MTIEQYRNMQKTLCVPFMKHAECNPLSSATDPTQDVPVSKIMFGLNGEPLNVSKRSLTFNNLPIEKMTAIDRRNNDVFDAVGEMRQLESKVKSSKSKKQ